MPGFLLAAMLAVGQPPAASGSPFHNIVFARENREGWSLQAINVVGEPGGVPVINRMLCQAERDGVQVMTWRQGGVSFIFGGNVGQGDRRRWLSAISIRALVIDGVAYEVESHAHNSLTDRYTDVTYPASQIVYPLDEMFFNLTVKRQGSALWLDSNGLANELIEAMRVRVGFHVADGAPLVWLEVPMTGLGGALAWCQAAMASPAALRFHQQ